MLTNKMYISTNLQTKNFIHNFATIKEALSCKSNFQTFYRNCSYCHGQ